MVSLLKNNKNVLKTIGLYRISIKTEKISLNVGGYLQPKSTLMESSLPAGFRGKTISLNMGGLN